ncbi:hypothetical protein A7A12_01295 [Escherichia coli]|nr:hypothetical protein A7A12_01295 [Escherichia coli]
MTEMNDTSGRWSYARQLYGHVYTAKIGTLSELVGGGDSRSLRCPFGQHRYCRT